MFRFHYKIGNRLLIFQKLDEYFIIELVWMDFSNTKVMDFKPGILDTIVDRCNIIIYRFQVIIKVMVKIVLTINCWMPIRVGLRLMAGLMIHQMVSSH